MAKRCRQAWASHLEATRRCILDAADSCSGGGTALILGSGACLDVPVAELAARFATVVLVDAHHPRQARRLAREHRNVRLVAADATGVARAARDAAKRRADAAPLKKQIRELDKRMEKLSTRKAQLEQQLLVQYSADGSIELALLTDELNKCEEEWLALNEQCEALLHAD